MTALEAEIRRLIAIDGPMSVAAFMALCLGHPVHGYYTTRDPFGRGDSGARTTRGDNRITLRAQVGF